MGFRITTNMMMSTYRYNLMNSTQKRSDSADKVLTHRTFTSYSEDPASATQAFRLRQQWWQTQNQVDNNSATYSKFLNGWSNLGGIIKDLDNANAKVSSITGVTGTAGESRTALAQVLRNTADSVIQAMNQKVGEQFVFSGNDGLNVPFSWNEDHSELYYRGINVNAGSVEVPFVEESSWLKDWTAGIKTALADPTTSATDKAAFEKELEWCKYFAHETDTIPGTRAEGEAILDQGFKNAATAGGMSADDQEGWAKYYMHDAVEPPRDTEPAWAAAKDEYGLPQNIPTTLSDQDKKWLAYYNDQSDYNKLVKMNGEHLYVDLGMGLKEDVNGKLINGSAFDTSLSGIDFIGFGMDEDGDPENMAMLMRKLANVFETWDEDITPQGYDPSKATDPELQKMTSKELEETAFRLMDKLKAAQEATTERYVALDAQSSFLRTNQDRLEDQGTDLNEEILNIEQVDLADAITAFSWDMYCYNAALKIGTQLLSQSLIDYMS